MVTTYWRISNVAWTCREMFFFMLIYGRVANMTPMSIIFYFEQVNECWQLPTLVAKGFWHLNFAKSTLKNFYNAFFGVNVEKCFFFECMNWNISIFWRNFRRKIFFLKSLPGCWGRSWGFLNRFFSVFWSSWEYISGWNWHCMWWLISEHLNRF